MKADDSSAIQGRTWQASDSIAMDAVVSDEYASLELDDFQVRPSVEADRSGETGPDRIDLPTAEDGSRRIEDREQDESEGGDIRRGDPGDGEAVER